MFKIGDKIVGIDGAPYLLTGGGSLCRVIDIVDKDRINVKLIQTQNLNLSNITIDFTSIFMVESRHFTLVENTNNKNASTLLKKGDAF